MLIFLVTNTFSCKSSNTPYDELLQFQKYFKGINDYGVAPREQILEITPLDENGTKKVQSLKGYNKNDTWAIYLYLCGTDLESYNETQLSELTEFWSNEMMTKGMENQQEKQSKEIHSFFNDIQKKGMDLPSSFYFPDRLIDKSVYEKTTDFDDVDLNVIEKFDLSPVGAATLDLNEILAAKMNSNVKMYIQTGAAKKWTKPQINPNRLQRFVYDENGLNLIEEKPIQNMGEKETLIDFLNFCKKNPADHQVLIFWDHGGGPYGICYDEIYTKILSLEDIKDSLSSVYGTKINNPPFELIGFDACLMACTEVVDYLQGFSKYCVFSEEVEPGYGWFYTPWLTALCENPGMNGAQLGKEIIDSYVEFYANQHLNLPYVRLKDLTTLSLVDLQKAGKISKSYTELTSQIMKDLIISPEVLSVVSKAASRSLVFGDYSYQIYNLVDLKMFMENLNEYYPEQTNLVINAIDESVLYKRGTYSHSKATGISTYFPQNVNSLLGLKKYLNYINDVCKNDDVKSLYYYKIAGCLNDELSSYVLKKHNGVPPKIDTKILNSFSKEKITINEDNSFSVKTNQDVLNLIQDYDFSLALLVDDSILYYGNDYYVSFEEDGSLKTHFSGDWISLDGHPLFTEIIGYTKDAINYRSPILVDGVPHYLVFSYDLESKSYEISGLRDIENIELVGRDFFDLKTGNKISPIYEFNSISSEEYSSVLISQTIETFTYKSTSKIENSSLIDGTYLGFIRIEDIRSDEFYSPVVEFNIKNGKIISVKERKDFVNQK